MLNFNLPDELSNIEFNNTDDINILIGENGSGKSTLLSDILKHYSYNNIPVIAIANTIHDKFNFKSNKAYILKSNRGRSLVKNIFHQSLVNFNEKDTRHSRTIANILDYVGYSPRVGFKITFVLKNMRNENILNQLSNEELDIYRFIINRYFTRQLESEVIWIDFSQKNFYDIVDLYFLNIFKFYKKFKEINLVREINFYFEKNQKSIPLYGASSGELTVISILIYISSVIQSNYIIIVDEPENSLHPKWQSDYTKKLLELFYLYNPKIVLATHSPIIISGSESNFPQTKTFKSNGEMFELQKKEPLNIEEILFRYFNVATPENRFLSEHLIRYLNLLSNEKMDIENFEIIINRIIRDCFDENQKRVLEEIKAVGRQIINAESNEF
ncbi:AAA family ATPase [Flavobacterium rhizosphaerae]|uniref:AAA family ATPase n=1 Tax=Flavobacterium rhizosphaerae TaxID=3163298 RepID=A0ABW8YYZ8_9FLAO